jgi:hypothetical protein
LAEAEFALVRFSLDLLSACSLELGDLLGLRRALHAAGRRLSRERRLALFEPPLSCDPAALRRYQKPSPPFVIRVVPQLVGEYYEGDRLEFEVLFLGTGTLAIGDFLEILQIQGERGLARGEGRFEVTSAHCRGADGKWRQFWCDTQPRGEIASELVPLDQWLDQVWPECLPVTLELITPARLVTGGRVLRRPQFSQLFPFLLRRVSSMLYAHCGIEAVSEPAMLCDEAGQIVSEWLERRWIDWRSSGEIADGESLGGCVGRLRLGGTGIEGLLWVILLATLFGVGRGAAYGAGQCRLNLSDKLAVDWAPDIMYAGDFTEER